MSAPALPDPPFWRVAVVEDHLLQRMRTEELIASDPGLRVVHSCATVTNLLEWVAGLERHALPHLVVLDLLVERGPSVNADHIRFLRSRGIRILVLSAMASPGQVRSIIRAGVDGVVGKRDTEATIVDAVWASLRREGWLSPEAAAVLAGDADRPRLSDQEERALVLYASGLKLADVASSLGVQPDTAKQYLDRVRAKYVAAGRPLSTKLDMFREAMRDGLLVDEP